MYDISWMWLCIMIKKHNVNPIDQGSAFSHIQRINFYLLRTFCPHLGSFLCCFFFHYISAKFHLWPSSGDLSRPWIGMLSLVTVSPVITAFHSCCLSHHIFDQVNLWPAWVEFETAIFWQWSPGTVETQRLYPLRHGPQRAIKDGFFGLINPYLVIQLQDSAFLSEVAVNHLKKARGEIWPKRSERRNNTKKLPRWGQKVRNK